MKNYVSKIFKIGMFINIPVLILISSVFASAASEKYSGKIVDCKGVVQFMSAEREESWQPVVPGKMLSEGDVVKTGSAGWAAVLMNDETLIQIGRNSIFAVKMTARRAGWMHQDMQTSGASEYRLDSGQVWMRNKNKNVQVDIETPSVTAAIRGTELNIQVTEADTTFVTVLSGRVGCRNESGAILGVTNDLIEARLGQSPTRKILLTPEDAVQWTITVPSIMSCFDMPLTGFNRKFLENKNADSENLCRANNFDAILKIAEIKRDIGKPFEAEALFKKIIGTDSQNNFVSKPEMNSGQNGAGSTDADSILIRNKRAFCGLGWVYLDLDKPENAEAAFNAASQNEKMVLIGLSEVFLRRNQTEKAEKIIARGLGLYPESPEFLLQKALLQLKLRETDIAVSLLEELTEKNPEYPAGWSILSLVYLYKGERKPALEYSEKAIKLAPESPTPYVIQSFAYQATFDLESAENSNMLALERDPENIHALVNLAKLQFGSDHADDALVTVRKAENLYPGNADVHSVKGFILLALRKTDEAVENFKKAVSEDRSSGEAYLGYALAMMRQGETDTALESISAAITLEPRRSIYVSYWGKMLHEIKRFDRALEVLDLAADLDPKDPTPQLYKAIILNDLDRPTEAIEALNRSIALNDNKAVYNSKFILDRDLAVKAVGLAYLYNRLGLSDWATNKALASLKRDHTNFAAHMFYGGGFLYDGDKSRLYSSEVLIGKLLQPATSNTFNSFNNYTSFFEKPAVNATLAGEHSSHDTNAGSLTVSGAAPAINSAFTASMQKKSSDGWKDSGKSEITGTAGEVKFDPTIKDNITIQGSYYSTDGKYDQSPFEYSYSPDPEEKFKSSGLRSEAGYHRHFGPGQDLLFYFKRIDNDRTLHYHDKYGPFYFENSEPPPDMITVNGNIYSKENWKQPLYQLQGQYHFSAGNHQMTFGGLRYWDDIARNEYIADIMYIPEYDYTYAEETVESNKVPNTFSCGYIKDIWGITPDIILESALYYDVMDYKSAYSNLQADHRELNPRLGIIWQPASSHTVRASAFRYLLPFYSSRIDSAEVAGFPVFRNSASGDVTFEENIAYEYGWETGMAGADVFYLDRENKYKVHDTEGNIVSQTDSGYSKGFSVFLNQLVNNGIGLRARYSYKDVSNDVKSSASMRDHQVRITATGVHEEGVYASLSQTFRYMDRVGTGLSDEDAWLTDFTAGVDFRDKKGSLSFMVLNIFDNHFDWTQEAYFTEGGRTPATEYRLIAALYF